jgi:NADPH-dependent 2,4-dienoyl-CoA reductase/sulfur reductase-like enzyme
MCPLGVLRIGDRGRAAMKCDQCAERQSEGQPPACVAACPTRALQFVERESLATGEQHLAAVSVVAALTGGAEVEEDLAAQSRRRKAVAKPGGKPRRVVVIGANAAGAMAALHAADIGAKVTLIAAEEFSYRRPAIPALISGHIADISEARIYPREMFEKHGIEVRAPARAVAVDTAKKTVTVEAGGKREAISYDSCVLATGGTAARARIPGTDKRGVCTFTTSEGAHEIIRQAADAKAAVVIGAGFIALEVAQALLEKGLKVYFNVRSRILRRLVEPDISAFLEARFEQRGLTMLTGESINEIGGGDAVEFVVHQGKKIPVQLVVLGTGVSPNVALAKAAGLRLAESGAIAVDHHMRTSDPNVYAAGDCAEVPDATTGQFIYSAVGSTGALAASVPRAPTCRPTASSGRRPTASWASKSIRSATPRPPRPKWAST